MAEVKGRVVAVWCHAEWPGLQRASLVAYPLLRVEKKGGEKEKKKAEEPPSGRVVDIDQIYDEEQSAR